ncbi:MAG: hypothetical protein IH897_07000 [Planctomycetes bacterium]|nr:hypothetical protein [Planctomycetota bacterium]
MKILRHDDGPKFNNVLAASEPGDCIQFRKVPHQKHAVDSIFLVLRVPSEYIAKDARKPDGIFRVMVANLETGACSLVSQDRAMRFVNAEVQKL